MKTVINVCAVLSAVMLLLLCLSLGWIRRERGFLGVMVWGFLGALFLAAW